MIIADNRVPERAKETLLGFGEVLFLETEGITYKAISGHPDIFFCSVDKDLIVAPNLPEKFKGELHRRSIAFIEGEKAVGAEYPFRHANSFQLLGHNL